MHSPQSELQRFYSLFVRFLRITFRRFLGSYFRTLETPSSFQLPLSAFGIFRVGSFLQVLFNFQAPVLSLSSFRLVRRSFIIISHLLDFVKTFLLILSDFSFRFFNILCTSDKLLRPPCLQFRLRLFSTACLFYHIPKPLSTPF